MRGEKIYKILDFLEDGTANMIDLAGAFLSAGYGASMNKIDREYIKRNQYRENDKINREQKRCLEQYIYKLKADGLLQQDSKGEIKLSSKGKKKIEHLRRNQILNKNFYRKKISSKFLIISYDLPIAFNWERDKLRSVLEVLGFHMIHKSVWVGKVRVPTNFIEGLDKINILRYVEILEVTKHGSLKPI
ncbi:hypothetical protein A3I95_00110 [Candidatus Nomurabacteria bacterium RIFCSPLOWO2_02_FULL_44_12]|uniref:Transcriptional repressor PaaX-like central Cas2-like domain-containing protein n=1 Tax=Candidatus Nomurabacteria bacterium RIFCSPLOWO2_12_FULL_44_11 TaxID=1801796 RepID=A0A1F6Y6R1_9BACT|nr:MAG: hypothetical protein A3E95_02260 [Candidatus Nomurabacteria bacterium RIFCSPHIGHO2_12_FULL_44_22b]OGJ02053.1 MAG: hypothetical protein A3G53_03155 [Candidatus Nomurabacteria bacterium RIFCSPLOWO2_12_FULL_44_11]OGJ07157.1 MAG: hypothetical protein A3I95_00110 [Candidatus Nomurabacteria bacterium RIFCSPLOWO2_02_FULL_44_12]